MCLWSPTPYRPTSILKGLFISNLAMGAQNKVTEGRMDTNFYPFIKCLMSKINCLFLVCCKLLHAKFLYNKLFKIHVIILQKIVGTKSLQYLNNSKIRWNSGHKPLFNFFGWSISLNNCFCYWRRRAIIAVPESTNVLIVLTLTK